MTSDIPTLIMAGEYDAITPPAWGQLVGETLRNSYFFEYPGVGHGASASPGCLQGMMVDFFGDSATAPDDACLADMQDWKFVIPSALAAVEWVTFADEIMAIQGLVPYRWTEAQIGVYGRAASGTNVTALLMRSMEGTAQDLLDLLTKQLGLTASPEAVNQREANGLTWNLYAADVENLKIDFVLSDAEGLGLVCCSRAAPKNTTCSTTRSTCRPSTP